MSSTLGLLVKLRMHLSFGSCYSLQVIPKSTYPNSEIFWRHG